MTRAWWLACAIAGCSRPSPLEPIAIADPAAHWPGGGFVEMVPAIRPPTSLAGDDRITTWLRIPDGGAIGVRRLDDGRAVVRYPPGTIADRVELREPVSAPDDDHAWRVIDVRGTARRRRPRAFHCLQPTGAATRSPGSPGCAATRAPSAARDGPAGARAAGSAKVRRWRGCAG
jgi:hypothetical protein